MVTNNAKDLINKRIDESDVDYEIYPGYGFKVGDKIRFKKDLKVTSPQSNDYKEVIIKRGTRAKIRNLWRHKNSSTMSIVGIRFTARLDSLDNSEFDYVDLSYSGSNPLKDLISK